MIKRNVIRDHKNIENHLTELKVIYNNRTSAVKITQKKSRLITKLIMPFG